MRPIESTLTEELSRFVGSSTVHSSDAYPVRSYRQLVKQVAKLAYLNKDHLLFFRGQSKDYRHKAGASTFYPTIYRGDYLRQEEIHYRFEILNQATRHLTDLLSAEAVEGHREVRRKKYIQWSILQHYGVCDTPLLDFTHSLRVACSFAQLYHANTEGYLFVFGLPYVTNRISVHSEHDIVNVRLLSICPPDALRPYFQEGYLAGTEDITTEYESKTELDFKNRLIAKFRIPQGKQFWGEGFSSIPHSVLFPRGDKIGKLCRQIEVHLDNELQPGQLGEFMKEWTELEAYLLENARTREARVFSTREAINVLYKRKEIDQDMMYALEELRKFRNQVVHRPKVIEPGKLGAYIEKLRHTKAEVRLGI